VLDTLESGQNWQWAAFGKHPAAKDYFQLGENTPFFEGLFTWIEDGYQLLTTKEPAVSLGDNGDRISQELAGQLGPAPLCL